MSTLPDNTTKQLTSYDHGELRISHAARYVSRIKTLRKTHGQTDLKIT